MADFSAYAASSKVRVLRISRTIVHKTFMHRLRKEKREIGVQYFGKIRSEKLSKSASLQVPARATDSAQASAMELARSSTL